MITKPMLASAVDGAVQFPAIASPKLDGIRCLVFSDGRILSRNFKPIPNAFIRAQLAAITRRKKSKWWIVDGELTLGDPTGSFQAVSSSVMSEDGEPRFVYRVFDFVDDSNGPTQSFVDRFKILEAWYAGLPVNVRAFVDIVDHRLVTCLDDLDKLEAMWLGMGYEGVMIRDPHGPYKCGRSTPREGYLLKLKRFVDAEAEVIGYEERMHNTNEAKRDELGRTKRSSAKAGKVGIETLGALLVRDLKTGVEFSVGTGFDDGQRSALWTQKSSLVGKIVKYKSQPTGVKDAPRFPVFLGFRDPRDL